ncbi:hypothetical protein E2C01_062948 [Portunus trituberculatus]|uniref:Uncharacterized protein n=1 Tax=Portunus trituberculatus TaxID=210409 RepID=A0A5B7H989_PORTR|nr:hypothetical protein [Portunus trituberculatus]
MVRVEKGPHERRDGRVCVKHGHQAPPSLRSLFTCWEVKEDKDPGLDIVSDNTDQKHVHNDLEGFRKQLVSRRESSIVWALMDSPLLLCRHVNRLSAVCSNLRHIK